MGLIKAIGDIVGGVVGAATGGVSTTATAAWQDYFESGDMSGGILMKRGEKILGPDSKNKKGDWNIITSGSGIDVQVNQCMILVENGKIVELCAEPGRYTYDSSAAPSFIAGKNKGFGATMSMLGQQIMAGGQRTNTERVFYINLGEIQGFKWGSGNISFQHIEKDLATDRPVWQCSTTLQGNGVYSIHVTDPMKFYRMLGSAVAGDDGDGVVSREDIDTQIKSEVVAAIRQGIGGLSKLKIPYTDIATHEAELTNDVNQLLSTSWGAERGIQLFKLAINMLDPDEESKDKIGKYQETKGYTDPSMLAAYMGVGQTEAMKAAGGNAAGAMTGFAGLGMMGNVAGNNNVSSMMQMGQQQAQQQQAQQQAAQPQQMQQAAPAPQPSQTATVAAAVAAGSWTCACGAANTGNFCTSCGQAKPVAAAPVCAKCGWTDPAMKAKPKFCPNCGSPL